MNLDSFGFVLLAAAFHAGWNILLKKSRFDQVVVLSIGQLLSGCVMFLFFVAFFEIPAGFFSDGANLLKVTASGLSRVPYLFFLGIGYRTGAMSVFYPISRGTGIATTAILAFVLIHQPFQFGGILGITLIVFGILIVSLSEKHFDASMEASRKIIRMAAYAGLSIGIYSTIDKYAMSEGLQPILFISLSNIVSGSFISIYSFGKNPAKYGRILRHAFKDYAISGFGGIWTYLLILQAFKTSPAPYVVAIRETSIFFALLFSALFLNERVTAVKWTGAAFILAGAFAIQFL